MTKKLLYGVALIAGLASCSDDYTDWANPQSNAANEAAEKFTMTVTPLVSAIDFTTETADSIQLFTTNLAAGQADQYNLTISAADKTETATIVASADGKVAAADIQNAVATIYGKAPTPRTLAVGTQADVTITTADGSVVASKSGEPFALNVKLLAPYISEHYYIIGAPSSWSLGDTSLPFTHSDVNVYDDPVFTVMFPVTDGEYWFAIADDKTDVAGNDWKTLLGCAEGNGNNGTSGSIIRRNEAASDLGDCSWKVTVAGDAKYIRMTINMMDYTYSIEKLNFGESIYMPGNPQGWNPATAPMLKCNNYNGVYTGYAYMDGDFKFTLGPNWDSEYNYSTFNTYSDGFSGEGTGNINQANAGYYYIEANVPSASLTASAASFVIKGDVTPSGYNDWSTGYPMTYDKSEDCWTATLYLFPADNSSTWGFKFVDEARNTWLGGSFDNICDGGNLNVTEAGTYTVKFYPSRSNGHANMYATLTKDSASRHR